MFVFISNKTTTVRASLALFLISLTFWLMAAWANYPIQNLSAAPNVDSEEADGEGDVAAVESTVEPTVEPTSSGLSCLRTTLDDLTINVMGYQDQGNGATKVLYLVSNRGSEPIQNLTFGTGSGQPAAPADGTVYTSALATYQVEWHGPSIKFMLEPEGPNMSLEIFEIFIRDFDPASEIEIINEVEGTSNSTTIKLSENSACEGKPVQVYQPSDESHILKEHIANREEIPLDKLKLSSEHISTYPNLEREFRLATFLDTRPNGVFHIAMIDLQNGEIIDDILAIREAEAEARLARYGKLEERLYKLLQDADSESTWTIAVWVNGASPTDQQDIEQIIADQYPEARETLEAGLPVWGIEDRELSQTIKREYERLATEQTEQRMGSVIEFIQDEFGTEVTTLGSIPSFTFSLTEPQIRILAEHPQVETIYWVGQVEAVKGIVTEVSTPTPAGPTPTPAPTNTPTPTPVVPRITVGDYTVAPDGTVDVLIEAVDFANIATVTVDVGYDPAVLQIVSCHADVDHKFDIALCNPNFGPDIVRFTMLSIATQGIGGEFTLAQLTFEAIGQIGDESAVTLQVETSVAATHNLVETIPVDGRVRISTQSVGDEGADDQSVDATNSRVKGSITTLKKIYLPWIER